MNGDVNFEFGVSVKNQLKNSGKTTKTFFHNTSNLASLLNKLTNIQKNMYFIIQLLIMLMINLCSL